MLHAENKLGGLPGSAKKIVEVELGCDNTNTFSTPLKIWAHKPVLITVGGIMVQNLQVFIAFSRTKYHQM